MRILRILHNNRKCLTFKTGNIFHSMLIGKLRVTSKKHNCFQKCLNHQGNVYMKGARVPEVNKPSLRTLQCKILGVHTWRRVGEPCVGQDRYVPSLSSCLSLATPTHPSLAYPWASWAKRHQFSSNLHVSRLSSLHHSFLFDVPNYFSYFFHIVADFIASFDLSLKFDLSWYSEVFSNALKYNYAFLHFISAS